MQGSHQENAMDDEDDGTPIHERNYCCRFCCSSKRGKKSPAIDNAESIERVSQTLSGITLADDIGSSGTVSVSSCQGQLIGFKRKFRFVDSRYKRPRFQRCRQKMFQRLSPTTREESTSSCAGTYPYSRAERSQGTESDGVKERRVRDDIRVRKGGCGWNLDFKDLPQDLVETFLMRLPFVSLYRSRLVSRQWNSIISSIISDSQGRELWAKNKPVERWVLLYNKMQEVLFYDVQRNVCYNWHKRFWPRIAGSQHHFSRATSFNGTVFLSICRPDIHSHTRIWECNPLTDGYDQLPLMPHNTVSVLDMVAVRRVDTVPGSYKLLVLSSDYKLPGATRLQVYDPATKEWEEVANLIVSDMWIPEVVKSFGTSNGKVAVLDKFQTNLRDPILTIHCYSLYGNEWTTHQLQGLPTGGHILQQWEVFERDWELILLLVDRDPMHPLRSPRAQIWRKPLPLPVDRQPPRESPWQLLSTMPRSLKILEVSDDGVASTGTTHSTAGHILYDEELKVFAVADEINGDRLVIVSSRSEYVVTFNFSVAPRHAWVAIHFSTLQSRSTKSASIFFGNSVRGPSSNECEKVQGKICRLLTDRSMMGVTFEPDVRWR